MAAYDNSINKLVPNTVVAPVKSEAEVCANNPIFNPSETTGEETAQNQPSESAVKDVKTLEEELKKLLGNEVFQQIKSLYNEISKIYSSNYTLDENACKKIYNYFQELVGKIRQSGKEVTIETLFEAHGKEVFNKTTSLLSKENITLNDIKEAGLLPSFLIISGLKSPEELDKLSEDEFQEIIGLWKRAYEENKETGDGIKITITAQDYLMLKKNGISVDKFKEMRANGEIKSLRELLGLKEGEEITPEMVKKLAEKQMEAFKKEIDSISDPKLKAKRTKELIDEQKQTFAKVLAATDIKDRAAVFEIISNAFAENRVLFMSEYFQSLDPSTREEIAKNIDDKKFKELISNDVLGNKVDDNTATSIVKTVYDYVDHTNEKAEEIAAQCLQDKIEEIKAILKKQESGEELSEEEKAKLDNYQLNKIKNAAYTLSSAGDYRLSRENFKEIAQILQSAAYESGQLRDVNELIYSNTKDSSNIGRYSIEEFNKLLDETSNGNYSVVVNDIKNGTTTELNKIDTAPKGGLGFNNSSSDIDSKKDNVNNRISSLYEAENTPEITVVRNNNTEDSKSSDNSASTVKGGRITAKTIAEYASMGAEGFNKLVENTGIKSAVQGVVNNLDSANAALINQAVKSYELFTNFQEDILKRANNSGLALLLSHTKESVLKGLKGETFSNYYATKQVNDAVEEAEKRENA